MTCFPDPARRGLGAILTLGCLAMVASFSEAEAGIVLNNLNQSDDFVSQGQLVGAALRLGVTPIVVDSITYSEVSFGGPSPGETFAIYSRKSDGTLGSVLYNNFSLTTDNNTFFTTATANSRFVLAANTSYWLVMVESPGTTGGWDASASTSYTANFGVTMPTTDTSFTFLSGSFSYFNLSDGPQLYNLAGTAAVPEPTSLALSATAAAVGLAVVGLRRRGAG